MAIPDLAWFLVYPVSLLLVIGFRFCCAQLQPNTQVSRKVAQASYWGEYADSRNSVDPNQVRVASITPPPEQSPPSNSRGGVVWPHCWAGAAIATAAEVACEVACDCCSAMSVAA